MAGQGPVNRATVTRLDAAGQIQWTQSLNIASAWNDAVLAPDGDLLPAGTYLYNLQAGSFRATRKLLVIR